MSMDVLWMSMDGNGGAQGRSCYTRGSLRNQTLMLSFLWDRTPLLGFAWASLKNPESDVVLVGLWVVAKILAEKLLVLLFSC